MLQPKNAPIISLICFHYHRLKIHQVCSGTNDTDDRTDASLAVAKLKDSNDVQFQTLNQRIADVCDIIVFSNQTNTADFAATGPKVSGLGYIIEVFTCT